MTGLANIWSHIRPVRVFFCLQAVDRVRKQCKTLSEAQQTHLAISLDDIIFLLPEDVSVYFDESGECVHSSYAEPTEISTLLKCQICLCCNMGCKKVEKSSTFWKLARILGNFPDIFGKFLEMFHPFANLAVTLGICKNTADFQKHS